MRCTTYVEGQSTQRTRHSLRFQHPTTRVSVELMFAFDMDARTAMEVFKQRVDLQPCRAGKRKRYSSDLVRHGSSSESSCSNGEKRRKCSSDFDVLCESSANVWRPSRFGERCAAVHEKYHPVGKGIERPLFPAYSYILARVFARSGRDENQR